MSSEEYFIKSNCFFFCYNSLSTEEDPEEEEDDELLLLGLYAGLVHYVVFLAPNQTPVWYCSLLYGRGKKIFDMFFYLLD